MDAVLARCVDAEEKARAALKSGTLSDLTALMAALALVMASGALGHTSEITPVFKEAIERATNSYETSAMRFWFGGVYLRACRINGLIDECQRASLHACGAGHGRARAGVGQPGVLAGPRRVDAR